MGTDDVSSIYPLETNDNYFNGDNHQQMQHRPIKRDESVGALNDLLESLNKSNDNVYEKQVKRENSTSSETGGSNQESSTPPVQDIGKGHKIETPKQKKINPWKAPVVNLNNNRSGKKGMRKDSSTSDIEEYKAMHNKLSSPGKHNQQKNNSFY
jgi:hypothetical protein